ncbi:MAG TPA: PAS domain S-box protein [Pyrinomonadaceae bacterium]|nr:PAS domain S-box protein [Pyrinomonadaceae bacterium]
MPDPDFVTPHDAEREGGRAPDTAWGRYGLAVAAVAAAAVLTFALRGVLGWQSVRIVFIFFFPAVLLTALRAGRGPALLAIALSALAGNYFFLPPFYSLSLGFEEAFQTVLFVLVAGTVVYLSDRSRRAEASARISEESLATTLRSIGDAVIATDRGGRVEFMNAVAERLTGWTGEEARGRPLAEVFRIFNEETRAPVEGPVAKVLRDGVVVGLANHTVLVARDGRETPVEDSAAPIRDARGRTTGVVLVFHDITERRQAEVERERLAALVASSDDAIIGKTLDGRITSWNAAAERLYGYAAAEAVGQPISIIVPPEREDELASVMARIRRGEPVEHLETVRVRKDGTRVEVAVTISPVSDREGRLAGASVIARDITARRRDEVEREQLLQREQAARAATEASEQHYRALADAMPQIVWTARPDGFTDYYNRRWYEYTGLTPGQAEGWGWQHVVHPEDAERSVRAWATAVATGEDYQVECRFRRASDGQYRWHLGRAEALRDASGRIVKWFGTATDIHEKREAEERVRFLAEASRVLSSSLDYETTLGELARLAVAALADYSVVDVLGDDGRIRRAAVFHRDPARLPLAERLRDYPPDPSKPLGVAGVLRTGRPLVVPEVGEELLTSVARDESHLALLRELGAAASLTVPLVARGRTFGALSFVSAGAPREYSADDVAFAEELARRAALAVDNALLYGRAQEANRVKDEFLATLSHELRTPLTPIIGWSHMLRSGRLGAADAAQGLHVIDRNSQALSRLINDLLDMSSILSGKMRIERAPVVLGDVLREAVETVRPQADARRVTVEVATGGLGPVTVSGDRTRLVQVFWNLIHNAVKFSREGGRVRVNCRAEGGSARVEVSDEGAGIAPDFLPHVFERFRQADMGTTRAHGGLGIGLALVKSFVEAHGGRVEAASAGEGRGSRFTVTLPALAAPPEREPGGDSEGAAEACAEPACRVLLVEDARDTLDMLRVVFEARGYVTETCASPEEALRVAGSGRFDIIVSDIGLPRMDGYELIRRLRRMPHLGETPAVALTGYAAPRDAEAALDAGFDAHVAKPVDPSALAEQVEQLLKRRAQGDGDESSSQ